ncbi:NAD(P)/FAD-dependent oxidoreductase [Pseudomonas oryzihabitans]|uniref:flavin-containing monooxygenase n=1 Tax=Pseudomonas oryzihabitans TaxID=47885 RepID=UPI00289477C1|nr:NAD(P)/FAD-dependent oxidoreductase [Pseudomonas oryzihabitans]MDT3722830.1 NAD(P)/FAD-dependent oxidoreductase [Pseudomonas oryzihabitans]
MSYIAGYCIIGAGAAGMAALKEMLASGYAVDCYEKQAEVAGHWNVDYDALHLITPRSTSFFDGFPMPDNYPLYPSRDQVKQYMNDFADQFSLREHIKFNCAVTAVEPLGDQGEDGWRVTLTNGQVRQYAGVLVANGHLWDCKMPAVAEKFTGVSIHSGKYQNTQQIKGRVLVVGFGNSGCDLAVDAAQARLDTTIAIRRGQLFQPKTLFGLPRAELAFVNQLPAEQQNMVMNLLITASLGSHTQYPGLPAPETYDLDKQPPVVNNLLLYWIQHGRIKVAPGIEDIIGTDVTFTDGRTEHFDTILWATGFHARLPFLNSQLLEWRDGVPLRTAAMTLPTTLESLYFIGLSAPRGAQWPTYGTQTRLVQKIISLRERGVKGLARKFAQLQQHDSRIDIVRREWQQNLDDTLAQLNAMALVAEPSKNLARPT